jgi:hypothetical protein
VSPGAGAASAAALAAVSLCRLRHRAAHGAAQQYGRGEEGRLLRAAGSDRPQIDGPDLPRADIFPKSQPDSCIIIMSEQKARNRSALPSETLLTHICLRHSPMRDEALEALRLNPKYIQDIFLTGTQKETELVRMFPGLSDYSPGRHQLGHVQPFQKSAINTNYIYSRCPSSGDSLRTNISFLTLHGAWPIIFYYFSGDIDFYLIAGGHTGSKLFIYIPCHSLIVASNSKQPLSNAEGSSRLVNLFSSLCDKYPNEVDKHLRSSRARLTTVLTNYSAAIYFAVAGDYSSIYYMTKYCRHYHDIRIASMGRDFLAIGPYLDSDYSQLELPVDCESLFKLSISSTYFFLQPTARISPEFCDFLVSRSRILLEKSPCPIDARSQAMLSGSSELRILIILRTDRRIWLEQEQGISLIISRLKEAYPRLVVVFDGYTNYASGKLASKAYDIIEQQKNLASAIALSSGLESYISIIGRSLDAKIALASYCNCYLVGFGQAMLLPFIIGTPGVIHASAEQACNRKIEIEAEGFTGGRNPTPLVVSSKSFQSGDFDKGLIKNNLDLSRLPYYNTNYSIDPLDFLEPMMSIARDLCPNS